MTVAHVLISIFIERRYTIYPMFHNYPDIINVGQLCEMLGIGRNSAYDLLHSGQINHLHVGRKHIIPKAAVIGFIEQNCYTNRQIINGGLQIV